MAFDKGKKSKQFIFYCKLLLININYMFKEDKIIKNKSFLTFKTNCTKKS